MARKTSSIQETKEGELQRPYLYDVAPNNVHQATIMPLATQQGKAKSVKEWIAGIQAGTLRQTIQGYYDNIKTFDVPFIPKDVHKLTRIQQYQELNRIKKFINDYGDKTTIEESQE